jgi:uncharacterized protein with GYD domain
MRSKAVQLALLLVAMAACTAARDDVETLKAQADREQQSRLYAQVVRHDVEVADQYFTAGDVDKAQAVIAEIVAYTDKCVAAARKNPKKLKETELELHKAGVRLEAVRRTLAFDDRPPVKDAVDKIEKARTVLLDLMFHPDKPKPEEKKP